MWLPFNAKIWFYRKSIDFRKQIDGLMVLVADTLEQYRFKFPSISYGAMELSSQQLAHLLSGLDMSKMEQYKPLKYTHFIKIVSMVLIIHLQSFNEYLN